MIAIEAELDLQHQGYVDRKQKRVVSRWSLEKVGYANLIVAETTHDTQTPRYVVGKDTQKPSLKEQIPAAPRSRSTTRPSSPR